MSWTTSIRKLALTAHITASVGWIGAVLAFLPLAVAGVISKDGETVRGVYLVMELIGWYALVPLAVASLLTGLVQSLVTPWGLLRHYWVVFKLLITVVATIVLVTYMETLSLLADSVAAGGDLGLLRSPGTVLHAGIGLLLLLVATVLAVYKPRGVTRYGKRQHEQGALAHQHGQRATS